VTDERTQLAQDVMMARREVGHLLTQLNQVVDRVVMLAALLNKVYTQVQAPPTGTNSS
jgi:hypothetical protein